MSHFPALDCHAHIAPDVTASQVRTLHGAQIFAMTRTLDEFDAAIANPQNGLIWGVGTHPAVPPALAQWSTERFARATSRSVLIGEVGLDRRGNGTVQERTLDGILHSAPPALISVHSTGRSRQVVDAVKRRPHPGVILHWFTGDREDIERATAAGCYFSINAAMSDAQMTSLPLDRVLPETDFPASRSRTKAHAPGDIAALEDTVARLTRLSLDQVRRRWYQNLGTLIARAGVRGQLPASLREAIELATTP